MTSRDYDYVQQRIEAMEKQGEIQKAHETQQSPFSHSICPACGNPVTDAMAAAHDCHEGRVLKDVKSLSEESEEQFQNHNRYQECSCQECRYWRNAKLAGEMGSAFASKIESAYKEIYSNPQEIGGEDATQGRQETTTVRRREEGRREEKMKSRRLRKFYMADQDLLHMMQAFASGEDDLGRKVEIQTELPRGAKVLRVFYEQERMGLGIVVEHESFDEIEEGCIIAEYGVASPRAYSLRVIA